MQYVSVKKTGSGATFAIFSVSEILYEVDHEPSDFYIRTRDSEIVGIVDFLWRGKASRIMIMMGEQM